jgi:hypothetical protein
MSKRHTASRRRAYGRRQHELHERTERRDRVRSDRSWRFANELDLEPSAFDGRGSSQPFGFSD